MHVREEPRRVCLDLAQAEARAGVGAVRSEPGRERPLLAADRHSSAALVDVARDRRVRERNSRRAVATERGFVDVRRRLGGRAVVAAEVLERDVPADDLLRRVDAVEVVADRSLKTGCWNADVVDSVSAALVSTSGPKLSCEPSRERALGQESPWRSRST